jgi:hypothetical protein
LEPNPVRDAELTLQYPGRTDAEGPWFIGGSIRVSNLDDCVEVGIGGVSVERCIVFIGLLMPSPAMIRSGLYQPSIQAKIASSASCRLAQLCR